MRLWHLLLLLTALFISSCVTIPEPLQGDYPVSYPAEASIAQVGTRVRWGGNIIATNPEPAQTCFEILGKSLADTTRPVGTDETQGRFIACKEGFQDPELFKSGREITIIGTMDRVEQRNIGEYEYRYPVIDADVIYLWPEQPAYGNRPYPYYPYYWYRPYPFWGPFPFYGGYRGSFRGGFPGYYGRGYVRGGVKYRKR